MEFLGKSARNPRIFLKEVGDKRKGRKTRLKTDLEFKQKKIFDLNKNHNVDIFWTAFSGEKAFAAEQRSRELKKKNI